MTRFVGMSLMSWFCNLPPKKYKTMLRSFDPMKDQHPGNFCVTTLNQGGVNEALKQWVVDLVPGFLVPQATVLPVLWFVAFSISIMICIFLILSLRLKLYQATNPFTSLDDIPTSFNIIRGWSPSEWSLLCQSSGIHLGQTSWRLPDLRGLVESRKGYLP
jgi:hypothetical protein